MVDVFIVILIELVLYFSHKCLTQSNLDSYIFLEDNMLIFCVVTCKLE